MGLLTDKLADDEKNGRQPKRYIVTEAELQALTMASNIVAVNERYTACHSRPVPDWATHMISYYYFANSTHREINEELEIPK